jgi:hypothetical protein
MEPADRLFGQQEKRPAPKPGVILTALYGQIVVLALFCFALGATSESLFQEIKAGDPYGTVFMDRIIVIVSALCVLLFSLTVRTLLRRFLAACAPKPESLWDPSQHIPPPLP